MGYTKLFQEIIHSTIWDEKPHIKIVWVTMLAMKDDRHEVRSSLPGLAHASRVSLQECEEAIEKFLRPDPYSRSKEFDGKRIEEVDGGWRILNGEKYRELRNNEERREYMRKYMKSYREQNKDVNNSVNNSKQSLTKINNVSPTEQNRTEQNKEYIAHDLSSDPLSKTTIPLFPPKAEARELVFSERFLKFWNSYPKKTGKIAAWKIWRRMKLEPKIENLCSALEAQKNSAQWREQNGRFIPNPSTWLAQGRWDDEVVEIDSSGINVKQVEENLRKQGLIA